MVIHLIHKIFQTSNKFFLNVVAMALTMQCAITVHAQELPLWKIHYDSTQHYWGKDWKKSIQNLQTAERSALSDLGMYDVNYLTIINDLGIAYWQAKDFANAEKTLIKSYKLKLELLDDNDPELIRAITNLAGLYTDQSKHAQARQLYKRVLKNINPAVEDLYWTSGKNLLANYEQDAQLDSATLLIEKLASQNHGSSPQQKLRHYDFKIAEGRIARKRRHYDTAQEILAKIVTEISLHQDLILSDRYVQALHELGLTHLATGSFNKAEKNILLAFRITKSHHASNNTLLVEVLNSLASVYEKLSIYDKAVSYYQEALVLCERLGSQHFNSCLTLKSNLAGIQLKEGQLKPAIESYSNILSSISSHEQTSPLFQITVLNNLSAAYRKNKAYTQATTHLERAQKLINDYQLNDDDLAATVANNLAVLLTAQGKLEQALQQYKKAFDTRKKIYGDNSVLLMDLASNMAVVYWALKKEQEAIPLFQKSIELAVRQIHYTFPNLNEDEQVQFYKKLKEDFERFNTIAFQYAASKPELLTQVFNNQIIIKSLLFFTQQHRNDLIYNQKDSILIKQYDLVKEKREQLGLFYQLSLQEVKQVGISPTTLEKEIDELEKNISLKTSETVAEKLLAKATQWKNIQAAMAADEALIEIIRVRKYDFKHYQESLADRVSFGFTDSTHYAALVTTKETINNPTLVLMRNGFNMENRLLTYYRNALRFSVSDEHSYNSYWKAIDGAVTNKQKIFFAGDGVYYKLNINTFRNPVDGKFIVQHYNVHYLLNPAQYLEKTKINFTTQRAVLMGDPMFDLDIPKPSKTRNDEHGFSSLPGAQKEIQKLETLLKSKGWQTNAYLRNNATEKNVKSIQSPTILHIATHGFFSDDVVPLAEDVKKDFLFQSGLVLAGANKSLSDKTAQIEDDGILTAYEVMNLDLSKTDLVVLSACETGLGKIENGEGVFGLQRSFLQAGARDIMISLWKVDDQYTQELMVSFYQNLLSGKSKTDALKTAQLHLMKSTLDPLLWGGFILVGVD
ncbi:CHAT domain-containing protein [Pseudochryseolinea flava]|uniref:CHAT domain-containing protein n=1 Tax=Pseudochryseolinea flava TaxID=2059302 RepID=A0A364XU71_9BACT|nr:CHAT domain-containing protein [Pseudochryseolinea flava]RAV97887.1 hypothetical protein DQQ10_26385 [Pseudochryseolinea flava]